MIDSIIDQFQSNTHLQNLYPYIQQIPHFSSKTIIIQQSTSSIVQFICLHFVSKIIHQSYNHSIIHFANYLLNYQRES